MTRLRDWVAAAIVALFALFPLFPGAHAQTWYTIEVLMFESLDSDGEREEAWPAAPGRPPVDESIELLEASELPLFDGIEENSATALPHAFRLLPEEEFQLRGIWRRLRNSRGYRPLAQLAWRQPGFRKLEAKYAHIRTAYGIDPGTSRGSTSPAPGAQEGTNESRPNRPVLKSHVDGILRLYRRKYLHVDVDLLYTRRLPLVGMAIAPPRSDSPPTNELTEPTGPTENVFRLRSSRRMRSSELHYLDHPLFGVLVLATPFRLPKVAPPADPANPNPGPTRAKPASE